MKQLYIAFIFVCSALLSFAQTNPPAQNLPYTFTNLTGNILPTGMAAHRFAAIPTTRTTSQGTADIIYPAANASGGWRDEGTNGISILASGSQQAGAFVVAINTTGLSNIQVAWTARTILQQASRDNSIALQYRIGTTGNFIDVGTSYTSQGKVVGDAASFSETLPAAAENQTEVQVRWVYWESNGTSGSRDRIAVDDITISGTGSGGDTNPPLVSSFSPADDATNVAINATATITFNETVQKGIGNIRIIRVSDNFTMPLDVTSPSVTVSGTQASFALALTNSTAYYIEVDAGAFKDIANNNFAAITGNTTWNFTTVAPPADGVLGMTYTFNTCGNYFNEGFKTYSVTGAQVWTCTKFGRTYTTDPSPDSAIEMNGFNSGNQLNEDWFISPKFDLTGTDFPLLKFYSYSRFAGPSLSLRVSTNYSGSGDPALATWTTINGNFPGDNTNSWTLTDNINLSAYKTTNVHVAWVYTSTTAAASIWRLDDITIYNNATPPPSTLTVNGNLLDFHYINTGASSTGKTFSFYANDLTTHLLISAPAGFEVSKDGTTYSSSVTYTSAETVSGLQTAYVRFTPTAANTVYSGSLQFASTGINTNAIFVKGNTQILATTLNVVNWNIEWFGSTGQNPVDDNLAQANAKKVMDYLDADVYAAAEIVDVTRFGNLIGSLASAYSYVIGEYCSGGTTAGACASNQKLAFAYKTGVISNVTARPLMISSNSARINFANGRVPLLITGDVTKNGQTTSINFIVIHAKANTGNTQDQIDAYFERKAGNQELKDTLDTYFANSNIMLLGDFNDDLDRTIAPTTGADTVSSYQPLIADSTDANSYRSLTLPLSNFKLASTTGFPDVIDHVIISNEMASRYLSLSASIYNDIDVLASITDYDGTTSDHYPVMTRFLFGGTLPVKLVSFNATKEIASVKLIWSTSQEVNTREFVVERSTDGVNFEKITTVNARGNSTTGTSYQAGDVKPATGNNYYRLRTVDFDGKVEFSKIIKIYFSKAFTVSLSPNPASQNIRISLMNNKEALTMQIVDMNGKVVKSAILSNQVNYVSLTGLSQGLYLVKLKGTSETYTEKLIME